VALELLCRKSGIIENKFEIINSIHKVQGGTAIMKVKVIKKGEAKPAVEGPEPRPVTKKAAAREMVSTVTSWVSDLQQRKRKETAATLESFFSPNPATSRP
jgi:hypothetical protein